MPTLTAPKPTIGVGTGGGGTWSSSGNIKGPPGDVAGIPDPLVLNTVQCNTALMIGTNMRIVPTPTGGRIETRSITGVWSIQVEWP